MRFDAVIDLITVTFTEDSIGQQVEVKTVRTVFANEYAVSSREFYDAGANGMKPERRYQVRTCEYEDEQLMAVDDKEFNIIRVERRGEWSLLTCEGVVGNG